MPDCPICQLPATHRCHVKDKSTFDRGENHEYRNIIILCQTHHGVYFDNHSGRRRSYTHMVINIRDNQLWIVDPRLKSPRVEDIQVFDYIPRFDLIEEYVDWKNKNALTILRTSLYKHLRDN